MSEKLPISILCVEDEEIPRNALMTLLNRFVEHVEMACDGEEGWNKFQHLSPDVVITDVNMPKMDGLTMSSYIKECSPSTPIIIMSAHNTIDHLHSAIEAGIDKYLIKPINSHVLKAVIEQFAERIRLEKHEFALEQAKIKELAKIKESFIVLFTHELKTPLNVILNLTKHSINTLDEKLQDDPEILEMLRTVLYSAEEMNEKVVNLLDIARLKNHRFSLHFGEISLENLLYDEIEKIKLLHVDNTKTFYFEPTHKNKILTDFYLFRRLISNILSNAIKYAHSRITITIQTQGEHFSVQIDDDGKGIDITKKEALFDLFEQCECSESVYTRIHCGTGSGLYFCRLAAQELSLKLTINNNPLGGARMIIEGECNV